MRWYIIVPIIFLYKFFKGIKIYDHESDYFEFADARLTWSIILGRIQLEKMNFYYTSDEVFDRVRKKIKKHRTL